MATVITTNGHDDGLDLVLGPLVTGTVVGRIYWDAVGDNPGFVLRIQGPDDDVLHLSYPDSMAEIETDLAARGYTLESLSRDEIAALDR